MKRFLQLGAALVFTVILAGQSLAAPIGQVTAVIPGAFAQRGGQTAALNLKDGIEAADTLSTDASGRVEVLFADNSSVTLGPNTTMNMQEFAFDQGEPAFKAHLGQGLMRVITGAIVEQNPKGFSVTTPEANIGIRGTIITILSRNGFTTVWVENTTRQVFVNNTEVPSGQKITVPSVPPLIEIINPQDREFIRDNTATQGARDSGQPQSSPGGPTGAQAWNHPPTSLADIPLNSQTQGDNLTPINMLGTAIINGSITHQSSSFWNTTLFNGDFTIGVDLASGNVTSFNMSGSGEELSYVGVLTYNVSGGSGTVGPNGINITGFTGPVSNAIGAWILTIQDPSYFSGGPANISSVGNTISGTYSLNTDSAQILSQGLFDGTRTK